VIAHTFRSYMINVYATPVGTSDPDFVTILWQLVGKYVGVVHLHVVQGVFWESVPLKSGKWGSTSHLLCHGSHNSTPRWRRARRRPWRICKCPAIQQHGGTGMWVGVGVLTIGHFRMPLYVY
jgi:hypothetical protein